jgi:hypothetical protein
MEDHKVVRLFQWLDYTRRGCPNEYESDFQFQRPERSLLT